MLVKLGTDKKNTESTGLNVKKEDVQEKTPVDSQSNDRTEVENNNGEKIDIAHDEQLILNEEEKLATFRQQVIFWIFLESCLEMVGVAAVTLLAINWIPLRRLTEDNFWPLELFIIVSLIVRNHLYRIQALTRAPGCYLPKFIYWLELVALHLLLAIHFPILLSIPSLSPYFAVLAAAAMAATYTLIYVLVIKGKVTVENRSLYWCGMVVPVYALLSIQPVYFLFSGSHYQWLMINVGSAMVVVLIFSYESIWLAKRFVKSKKLEEICREREGVISLIDTGYIATVAFRQPSYYKKEMKTGDNEKV